MKKEEIERNKNIANTENTEQNEEIVSGVDRVKRPVWVRPLALAASVVLIAGTVVGSVALMKNAKPEKNNKSQATQTEAVATTQVTTQDIASEKITKEWLIDRFKDGKIYANKYYRESNTRFGRRIEAFDRENGIAYRKYFKQERDQGTSFDPLSGTFKTSVTTGQDESLEYMYKNKHLSLYINGTGEPTLNIDDEILYVESPSYYLKDADNVTLKGEEEYLGRNCAVIIYAPPPTGAEDEDYNKVEQWIDIETGTVLRAATIGEDDLKTEYTTETLAFYTEDEAASHIPTPQEFKQMIEPFGVKTEGRTDLDFLDETPIAVTTDASEIVTEIATNSETFPATEVETAPVTEAETEKVTEAETTKPAEQVPDNIDKDYIIDLCSHVTDHYDKLYIKGTYEIDDPTWKHISWDVTGQYDNRKKIKLDTHVISSPSYEFDNGIVADSYSYYYNDRAIELNRDDKIYIIHDKSKEPNCYYRSESIIALASYEYDDILDYTKDEMSITGMDTICGRKCAVVTIKTDSIELVDYIDIETGVVLKYSGRGKSESIEYEVTDIRYNDAADDVIAPSAFKRYIEDNGYVLTDSYKSDGKEDILLDQPLDLSFLDK
jgi:hypothetical protein